MYVVHDSLNVRCVRSSALNFEDYSKEWAAMGTSLPSDVTDEAIYSGLIPRGSFDRDYYGAIKP